MTEQHHPRKGRSDKGHVQLNDRDSLALSWIGEQYAVRLDQLQNLLGRHAGRGAKEEGWISESAVRFVVNRWKQARLAQDRKLTVEDPAWVWLTAQGVQQLDLPYKVYEPSLAKLEHLFAVNEVRLLLEEEQASGTWKSERALRAGVSYEKGETLPHTPDAEWIVQRDRIAIEVELTPKKPADLQAILQELTNQYRQVWYYVTRKTRSGVLATQKHLTPNCQERLQLFWCPPWDEET